MSVFPFPHSPFAGSTFCKICRSVSGCFGRDYEGKKYLNDAMPEKPQHSEQHKTNDSALAGTSLRLQINFGELRSFCLCVLQIFLRSCFCAGSTVGIARWRLIFLEQFVRCIPKLDLFCNANCGIVQLCPGLSTCTWRASAAAAKLPNPHVSSIIQRFKEILSFTSLCRCVTTVAVAGQVFRFPRMHYTINIYSLESFKSQ